MRATFNELAEAELNDAIAYYESEEFGLGSVFLAEVRRMTSAIVEYPNAGPIILGTVRRRLCASGLSHEFNASYNSGSASVGKSASVGAA